MRDLEGHYVTGFGDGSRRVLEAELLTLTASAEEEAGSVLVERPETTVRIDRVLALANGFESPYSLGLLATVHWAILPSGV